MVWYEILIYAVSIVLFFLIPFAVSLVAEYKRYKLLGIDWRRFIGLRNNFTFVIKSENIEVINSIKERFGITSDQVINSILESVSINAIDVSDE